MHAHPKAFCHLARRVSAFCHLLDRRDLEFLRVPLSTYIFSLTQNYGSGLSTIVVAIQMTFNTEISIIPRYDGVENIRIRFLTLRLCVRSWPDFVGQTCGLNRPRPPSNESRFSHFDPPRRMRRNASSKTVRPTASAGTKVTTRLPSGVEHDTTPAVMKAAIEPRRMATTGSLDDMRSP